MNKYLNLNRVEFAVTNRCTSHCRHCSVVDEAPAGTIDIDTAKAAIDGATDSYMIGSVMTFGGEPLLYPEITCAIHDHAAAKGVPKRQIITNGCWSGDIKRINEICRMLKDSAANDILLSVDAFHEEYLDFDIFKYTVEQLCELDVQRIRLHPCWYTGPDGDNPYDNVTRDYLDQLAYLNIGVSDGNTLGPSRNALRHFKEKFRPLAFFDKIKCNSEAYANTPEALDTLTVDPDGNVRVCGLPGITVLEFLENYDPHRDRLMDIFLNNGINGLLEEAKKRNVLLSIDDYYGPCTACMDIRRKLD